MEPDLLERRDTRLSAAFKTRGCIVEDVTLLPNHLPFRGIGPRAMSQHKAPTAITIAPTDEKSGLGQWVEKYWKFAALLVVGVAAIILFRANAQHAQRSEADSHWGKLLAV